jgi:putative transposase
MARIPRVVVPGVAHHVTQRGTRRMQVFFSEHDYRIYLQILSRQASQHSLDILVYCLMPNHVHLIAVPASPKGLSRPLGEAHRRYALAINGRQGWRGHLWQERFASFPLDEPHLLAAIRYILLNPVRAGLVARAVDWPHSSARAHILGVPDCLIDRRLVASLVDDWETCLNRMEPDKDDLIHCFRRHSRIGRPLGSDQFVDILEKATGRCLRPGKVGRKSKTK